MGAQSIRGGGHGTVILPYKYSGRPIHFFCLSEFAVYVTRGNSFCAVSGRYKQRPFLAVITPAGLSYHRVVLKAVERLALNTENRPPTEQGLITE